MTVLTISKRFVPLEQIAFVERIDSSDQSDFTQQNYRTRIVLINGDSILTEATVEAFVQEHGFNYLVKDDIALNGADVFFIVEAVEPSELRWPSPFKARLTWRGPDGVEPSQLLITAPVVVATLMTGPPKRDIAAARTPNRPSRSRKKVFKAGVVSR